MIDDTATPRFMREIDHRNISLRMSWYARSQMRISYTDTRGHYEGEAIDSDYEQKRRVARAILDDILSHRSWLKSLNNSGPMFLRKQAY